MKRIMPRTMVLFLSASLVLAVVGCDRDDISVEPNDQDNNQSTSPNNNQGDNNDDPNHQHGENNHEYDDDYWEAHGPDEDKELLEVGEMQGSWRAAYVEGDVPLAYFDIFHDEGESTAEGSYLMGNARGDFLDGLAGDIDEVSIDGDRVDIYWNPTDDEQEMYLLELTRQDEERFDGEFSAERYPNTHEVELVKRQFDD